MKSIISYTESIVIGWTGAVVNQPYDYYLRFQRPVRCFLVTNQVGVGTATIPPLGFQSHLYDGNNPFLIEGLAGGNLPGASIILDKIPILAAANYVFPSAVRGQEGSVIRCILVPNLVTGFVRVAVGYIDLEEFKKASGD